MAPFRLSRISRPRMTVVTLGSFWLGGLLRLASEVASSEDPPQPPPALVAFTVPGVEPRAADADAPLAEGWPQATRPGVIEVKAYPAYRGATTQGKNATMGADSVLFYPLFLHITRSKIEMTAPVINTFDPVLIDQPGATGDVAMEFVYRTPRTGQPGRDLGGVTVADHPGGSFVCLGVQGDLDPEKYRQAVATLRAWLDTHRAEWSPLGHPRRLGYHAPMVDKNTRWWEVQIPVGASAKPPRATLDPPPK